MFSAARRVSAGGTSISLTGTNFVSGHAYTASFGGGAPLIATFVDTAHLSVTSPSGLAGPTSITVSDTTIPVPATGSASFAYAAPPIVTSVLPPNGVIAGAGR